MIEQKYTTYPIKEQLLSQATRIIFTVTHRTKQPICLKMWRDCQDDLYDTNNIMMHPEWLLEGLCTNRRWTSNVYLGVAEVFDQDALIENAKEIHCGKLLRYPKESDLVAGKS